MSILELKWNATEKKVAHTAFDKAYQREMEEIKNTLEEKTTNLEDASDVWKLNNYLSDRRKEVDQKYDYRYSKLIYVFSNLMRQNFITEEDLVGLSENKINLIRKLLEY